MKEATTTGCVPLETIYSRVTGELADSEWSRVAEHVAGCSTCAAAMDFARSLGDLEAELGELSGRDGERDFTELARRTRASRAPGSSPPDGSQAGGSRADDAARTPPALRGITVLRHLASGGCADVWLARDEVSHLVVKVVRPEMADYELESLRHYKQLADDPRLGLFPIHYIGRCETTGRLAYTMPTADPVNGRTFDAADYVPATLTRVTAAAGGLPLEEVRAVADDVLDTLAGLHARGLVHRDVKPSNILRYHGRWCLADTGLLTREGAEGERVAGTPKYRPPGGRNDRRDADLYALGKTLYAALRGTLSGFPTPAAEHVGPGPASAEYAAFYRTIGRACEPDPSERRLSATGMRSSLRGEVRRPRRLGLAAAVVAGVALVSLAVFATSDESKVDAAAERVVQHQVGRLELRFGRPGASAASTLRPGTPLRTGVDVAPFVRGAAFEHLALVLVHYVGGERSVYPYPPAPTEEADLVRFSPDGPDDPEATFHFSEPTPLLSILIGSDAPLDLARVERRAEALLAAEPSWPARLAEGWAPGGEPPLRFHGPTVVPMAAAEPLRGGPRPEKGGPIGPARLASLVQALAREFGHVDGIVTEVGE